MVVGFCFVLVFLFVPETFWDRTPRPHAKSKRHPLASLSKIFHHGDHDKKSTADLGGDEALDARKLAIGNSGTIAQRRHEKNTHHVGFARDPPSATGGDDIVAEADNMSQHETTAVQIGTESRSEPTEPGALATDDEANDHIVQGSPQPLPKLLANHDLAALVVPRGEGPETPGLHSFNSPHYVSSEKAGGDYMNHHLKITGEESHTPNSVHPDGYIGSPSEKSPIRLQRYTTYLRTQPPKTYKQTLKPWNGRLRHEKWALVAIRPFILFAYPAILWSALIYSLSIGWLIVLSESVTTIYRTKSTYNFTALQAGLVYTSPFVGGILGTAVAGKFSDMIVRFMSRRNGGIYEPEFRLVMAIPVTIATCIGLMGYGWSAQERDNFMVPTVFFGVISFGCSLGSTTSITFAVDSYRQYAGEALVTLNFSKSERICRHLFLLGPADTNNSHRHLPWPCLFFVLQQLA